MSASGTRPRTASRAGSRSPSRELPCYGRLDGARDHRRRRAGRDVHRRAARRPSDLEPLHASTGDADDLPRRSPQRARGRDRGGRPERAARLPAGAGRGGQHPRVFGRDRARPRPRGAVDALELHRRHHDRLRAAPPAGRQCLRCRCLGHRRGDRVDVHRHPRGRRRPVLRSERQASLRYHQKRHHRGRRAPGRGPGGGAPHRRPRSSDCASPRGRPKSFRDHD